MNIDHLLEKYFEGTTSRTEERELRRFFTEEEVPEHLLAYRPLFACLAKEVEEVRRTKTARKPEAVVVRKRSVRHRTLYSLGGIAAGLLLLVGISGLFAPSVGTGSFVVIDGTRYTDRKLVEAKALEALQNVGFTDDELDGLLFQHGISRTMYNEK